MTDITTPTKTRTDLGFEHVLVRGSNNWTLLLLHGTGSDEHQLVDLGRRLAPQATLLSPRGKELENGVTRRFFRRRSLLELDIPDLLARTDELAEFVRAAVAAYALDPTRIVAVGYSNGSNIAVSLLFRQPEALRGAVLLRPTLPYEPDHPLSLNGKDVLVATGQRDAYVPLERTERLAQILRASGANVIYRVADAGHELVQAELADA
ncbi:MAG: alpha/beta hydrolase, partial [Anaerolineales bacterium]